MKVMQRILVALAVMFIVASPAFAVVGKNQDASGKTVETIAPDHAVFSGASIGAGIGVALSIVGAGYGFGRIGQAALESMARQPEIAARIQTAAIIIGALLEGATFFGLLICIILQAKANF